MKQIRTVIQPIWAVSEYDKRVNALLQEGWELTTRKVITAKGEPNEVGSCANETMLYAEFEK